MPVQQSAEADPKFDKISSVTIFDDFTWYTSTQQWTSIATGTGTSAADDTGGTDTLLLTTQAADNDIQGFRSTKKNFIFSAVQAIWCQALAAFTSLATRSAAYYFGFFSTTPQTSTSTTVPAASYSGAIIYCLEGDTYWRTQSSNGATKTNHTSTLPIKEGVMNSFRIDVINFDGSNVQVTYNVNGQTLMDSNYPNQPIVDTVSLTSIAAMYVGGLIQAGTAGAQTCNFDEVTAAKARALVPFA